MRFGCGDMRDHIVSYQNDHRPSYWRRRALRQQARLRIDFSEILRVVRFSTFATISAHNGHGRMSELSPECALKRTFANALGGGGITSPRSGAARPPQSRRSDPPRTSTAPT